MKEPDEDFLAKDVPMSKIVSQQNWHGYLYRIGDKPGMRILEIGSREVTGESNARNEFSKAEYVGFDYYPGRNVDVVGDAHKLSSYFGREEKFDIIYSSACFEHFAMPWLVAVEIAKLLKVGGIVFIETHFSFSSHERPWHFFQFSDMALKVLFSEALGFECIEAGMSNPIVGRFSSLAAEGLRNKPVIGLYCHTEYLGKKVKDVTNFDWQKVDLNNVVGGTKYPAPVVKFTNKSAEIISHTTPPQVDRNKKYEIKITVKNTGVDSWSEDRAIRLSIWQDRHDSYRVFLPAGVEVKRGEKYTFIFKDFQAPPDNVSTFLQYQMAEEGVTYFGEKKGVDITVK